MIIDILEFAVHGVLVGTDWEKGNLIRNCSLERPFCLQQEPPGRGEEKMKGQKIVSAGRIR